MPETTTVGRTVGTRSSVGYVIQGSFTSGGRTVPHRQYLSEHYVLTDFEGTSVIYLAEFGDRFVVDRERRLLNRIDTSTQRAQLEHLRSVLGTVVTECSSRIHVIDGYTCRLHSLRNENGRIGVIAEAWCTSVPGTEITVLHRERALDAQIYPFYLPLASDEIVVRSVMRTITDGTENRQTYQLRSLSRSPEELAEFDTLLEYTVRGATACSGAYPE